MYSQTPTAMKELSPTPITIRSAPRSRLSITLLRKTHAIEYPNAAARCRRTNPGLTGFGQGIRSVMRCTPNPRMAAATIIRSEMNAATGARTSGWLVRTSVVKSAHSGNHPISI